MQRQPAMQTTMMFAQRTNSHVSDRLHVEYTPPDDPIAVLRRGGGGVNRAPGRVQQQAKRDEHQRGGKGQRRALWEAACKGTP
jgi:hypothetical protein